MKRHIAIFIVSISTSLLCAKAYSAANCEDLSHRFTFHAMSVDYKQIACEKYKLTFRDPDGEPYSESETLFSSEFRTTQVDDEHELTSNQQRWMFSRDGKSIIHEAVIDSLNKKSSKKMFRSVIEIISKMQNGNIQRAITEMNRIEEKNGEVKVESKKTSKEYAPF